MKIHAYGGINLVPMAVPEICFKSNSEKFFWSTTSAMSTKSSIPQIFLKKKHLLMLRIFINLYVHPAYFFQCSFRNL